MIFSAKLRDILENLEKINVDHLLGRSKIPPDIELITKNVKQKPMGG